MGGYHDPARATEHHRSITHSLRLAIALSCSAALTGIPRLAHADDLGVLLFPLIVWPMMAVFGLLLVVLFVIGITALRKGRRDKGGFGLVAAIVAVSLDAMLAVSSLLIDHHFSRLDHLDAVLVHIGAFQVAAIPCVVVGMLLRKNAERTS